MSPVRLLAALAAIIVGLVIVLFAVDAGDDEATISIDGGQAAGSDDEATEPSGDVDSEGSDVDLPVTGPTVDDDVDASGAASDDGPADDSDGTASETEPPADPTTTVVDTTTTSAAPGPTTTTPLVLEPTDTFPCSFASRQAMLNRLSDIEDLDEFSDADLYLRTVARSILEVGQVLTEDERVTDLEVAFEAFRDFPGGCPEVIDDAFDTGDRFLCRAAQISVDERIHDYLERAVGALMDGCTYPEIDA
ncbi:MAG: hypothetical protein AAGF91_03750 [Actinomycetota bacterium]